MKFGLIGKKLGHSMSPIIQGDWGLDYVKKELPDEKALAEFVKSDEMAGFNVTVPYKQAIIPLLDEIDERAAKIGAVNTVVRRDGKLCGYNTDAAGMIYALERAKIKTDGKTVAILGTGGTSKTAEYVASSLGAKRVFKVGRTSHVNYENVYEQGAINVIIATTPVGMSPDIEGCLIRPERVHGLESVLDAVYNPLETELVTRAKAAGIRAANGIAMLVEQAREAHNLFCPENPLPVSETERMIKKLLFGRMNVVLVGMPGSGKTTVGERVAKLMNRPFIDLDAEICKNAGMTVPEIFASFGEAAFREKESQAASFAASQTGVVIATGGGTVKNYMNVRNLRRSGKIFFIDRPYELLPAGGRPLSESVGAKRLYFERLPLYRSAADYTVQNADPDFAAKEIVEIYEKDFGY